MSSNRNPFAKVVTRVDVPASVVGCYEYSTDERAEKENNGVEPQCTASSMEENPDIPAAPLDTSGGPLSVNQVRTQQQHRKQQQRATSPTREGRHLRLELHAAARSHEDAERNITLMAKIIEDRDGRLRELEAEVFRLKNLLDGKVAVTTANAYQGNVLSPPSSRDVGFDGARRATIVNISSPSPRRKARYSLGAKALLEGNRQSGLGSLPSTTTNPKKQLFRLSDEAELEPEGSRFSLKARMSLDTGGFHVRQQRAARAADAGKLLLGHSSSSTLASISSPTLTDRSFLPSSQLESAPWRRNFSEFTCLGADPRVLFEGSLPLVSMAPMSQSRTPAAVLDRWDGGPETMPPLGSNSSVRNSSSSNSSSSGGGIGGEVKQSVIPLLQDCCFPNGVELRLVSFSHAKRLAAPHRSRTSSLAPPAQGNSSTSSSFGVASGGGSSGGGGQHCKQHVLQFAHHDGGGGGTSTTLYGVCVAFPVLVPCPSSALVANLRARVASTLAALTVTHFLKRVGGKAAFAAYAAARRSNSEKSVPSTPGGLEFLRSPLSGFLQRHKLDYSSRLAGAAPDTATLSMPGLVAGGALLPAATLPLDTSPTQTAGLETAATTKTEEAANAEARRKCRALLFGPVAVVSEEAFAMLMHQPHHMGPMLRVLHALVDADLRPVPASAAIVTDDEEAAAAATAAAVNAAVNAAGGNGVIAITAVNAAGVDAAQTAVGASLKTAVSSAVGPRRMSLLATTMNTEEFTDEEEDSDEDDDEKEEEEEKGNENVNTFCEESTQATLTMPIPTVGVVSASSGGAAALTATTGRKKQSSASSSGAQVKARSDRRRRRLVAFLEHVQRWCDPPSSQPPPPPPPLSNPAAVTAAGGGGGGGAPTLLLSAGVTSPPSHGGSGGGGGRCWRVRYDRLGVNIEAPLSAATLEDWTLGVLFSVVPLQVVARVVHLLLCEGKVVVEASDAGVVSAVATALPFLVEPLAWECVHIPIKPSSLPAVDLLQCPNPFIVGVVSSGQGHGLPPEDIPPDVAVLRIDCGITTAAAAVVARSSGSSGSSGFRRGGGDAATALLLEGSEVRCPDMGARSAQLAINLEEALSSSSLPPPAVAGPLSPHSEGGRGGGGTSGLGSRPRGNFCSGSGAASGSSRSRYFTSEVARVFAHGGLTPHELQAVRSARAVLRAYVGAAAGGHKLLEEPGGWRKCAEFNSESNDFEFIPSTFLEPREQLVALQKELVHSQMFHAFISRCQDRDQKANVDSTAEGGISGWGVPEKRVCRK